MGRKRNVNDVLEELKKTPDKKNVLIRVDFNVPMNPEGKITDDSRIKGALPTINAVLDGGFNAILVSHMGRPKLVQKGGDDEETKKQKKELSLKPVADHLSKLISKDVIFAEDCLKAENTVAKLPKEGGGIVLLENLRFYKEEEKNDPEFAKTLASYADAFVNDAFGTCHRAHGSVSGVPANLPKELCGVGSLVEKELAYLLGAINDGKTPMAAIVGGSKVSTKITVLDALLDKCDKVIIGGGMVFTFLKAQGYGVGSSLVEDDYVDTAKKVLEKAEKMGKQIILPVDIVVADKFDKNANTQIVKADNIPDGWMGLDNGPETTVQQKEALSDCKTIIMNGPMGVFEFEKFATGTMALINIMADLTKEKGTITIIGGGDSVSATEQSGRARDMSHISTGGGASLELLEGKELPGVTAISEV